MTVMDRRRTREEGRKEEYTRLCSVLEFGVMGLEYSRRFAHVSYHQKKGNKNADVNTC